MTLDIGSDNTGMTQKEESKKISLSKVISVALTEEGEKNCRREALYC